MSKAAELAKIGEAVTSGQIGGRRNIAMNGAMLVSQRSASVTGIGASSGYFTLDRWKIAAANTAGRLTMAQVAITDLPGFTKCLKLSCTTADASIAAGELLMLHQNIEGQDLQQLKKGTSAAEKVTVSFYVKANAAATYTFELAEDNSSRKNAIEFSVTTGWTRIILTYDGDTTGPLDNDNTTGLQMFLWLHAGSTYTGGSHTDNVWHTTANQTVGDNNTSFFDATSRTLFITGFQMELGSQATPFEHRSIGEELSLCHRYYWNTYNGAAVGSNTGTVGAVGMSADGQNYDNIAMGHFPTTMRTTPTMVVYNPITGTAGSVRGDSSNFATCTILNRGPGYYCFNMNNTAIGESTFVSAHVTADADM